VGGAGNVGVVAAAAPDGESLGEWRGVDGDDDELLTCERQWAYGLRMRYAKLGLLIGSIAWGCGDDSTGEETAGDDLVTTTSSTTSGPEGSSTAGDDGTSGSASGEGSSGATGSSGAMDGSSGTSVGDTGLQGTFPCGDMLECDLATQYCQQTVGGAVGNPPSYSCMDLPDACAGGGTCECVAGVQCGEICEMIESGVQVTCQAP